MTEVLCITGMHRSGTSLVASWLARCGLAIHDGAVIGPHVGNPKGHFEDEDFVRLHSEAIRRLKPDSKGWKIYSDSFQPFRDVELARARALIAEREKKHILWGWKDPRTVLFLPQWKQLIPHLKVLMLWRPCAEVIDSLTTRAKHATDSAFAVSFTESAKLWIQHNQQIGEYLRDHPTDSVLLDLKHVCRNDRRAVDIINARLGLQLGLQPIQDVLEPRLLHDRASVTARLISRLFRAERTEERLRALSAR